MKKFIGYKNNKRVCTFTTAKTINDAWDDDNLNCDYIVEEV